LSIKFHKVLYRESSLNAFFYILPNRNFALRLSINGLGIEGMSTTGYGIKAKSTSNYGIYAETGNTGDDGFSVNGTAQHGIHIDGA